ncbi:flagellin [Variovorax humicola]|uniref:Flagellin n=1 Tax=Variovorax humicola TaxID=1769758 RepID=A0ABU8W6L4_9BURK
MASTINTNISSLTAQRNLSQSQNSLATSMQRLSSGLRINSAKDDAAGLAISERMTSQIRGMNQAVRNANDGISLAQTAEGSLGEIGNNLQRIRELAVQSANATNSSTDRTALNSEVTQLVSEIDRVSKQSDFNGTKLLDGSFSSQLFQVGANAGQTIGINKIANTTAAALGGAVFDSNSLTVAAPADGNTDVKISGFTITDSAGKTVTLDDITVKASGVDAATTQKAATAALASAINDKLGETGVMATVGTTAGAITLDSVKESVDSTGAFKGFAVAVGTWTGATAPTAPTTTTAAPAAKFAKDLDITTVKGAQQALALVDKALSTVNSSRADLGAIQNRFSSVVTNLTTNSENTSASRSRIQDADFATETANLSRAQILQQAGTAMVAQANQLPQTVLSLLK